MTELARVPPNVHFEVDDVEKRWMYDEPFDYIHCRAMSKSIADWPTLVRQCYKYVYLALYPSQVPSCLFTPIASRHLTFRFVAFPAL